MADKLGEAFAAEERRRELNKRVSDHHERSRSSCNWKPAAGALITIGIILLCVYADNNSSSNSAPSTSPTLAPSMSPTSGDDALAMADTTGPAQQLYQGAVAACLLLMTGVSIANLFRESASKTVVSTAQAAQQACDVVDSATQVAASALTKVGSFLSNCFTTSKEAGTAPRAVK